MSNTQLQTFIDEVGELSFDEKLRVLAAVLDSIRSSHKVNKHKLYIGRYSNSEPEINWEGEYTIWQYSENGIIPGIDAYVDLCRFRKDGWLEEILLPKD